MKPRLVDEAIDELEFQLEINQQLGEENERLRAENAAMRPIVAAVADMQPVHVGVDEGDVWLMPHNPTENGARELVEQARAFLATAGQAVESEGE